MAIKIAGNRVLDYDVLSYSNTNIAVGYQTLQSLTTGTNNSAVGNSALYDLTTATNNTVIGYNTGRGITTGSKNTIIGANVTGLSATLANTIILADGDGNQRIYVNSSGNVGIGTSSPTNVLDVVSTTQPSIMASTYISGSAAVAGYFAQAARGTVSSPTATQSGDRTVCLIGRSYGGTTWVNHGAINLYCAENQSESARGSYLTFDTTATGATGRSERMRIDSSGLVGIGKTGPTAAIDVLGPASTTAGRILGNANAAIVIDFNASGDNYYDASNHIFRNAGGSTERMRINSSGNITIGSLGVAIDSSKNFYPGNQTTKYIGYDGTGMGTYNSYFFVGGGYAFYSTGTTVLRGPVLNDIATYLQINGGTSGHTYFNGNVGIGTSSPGKKLDIISGAEVGLRIAASATSGYAYIQLGQSATAANNWHFGSENDGSLRFYNGNWGSGTFRAYLNNLHNGTFHINDVAIGRGGGGILDNMAVGYLALNSNTTNGANTALGPYALQYNTGYDNTAVGYVSLRNNTTGVVNTAVGAYALNTNTVGDGDTAVGQAALQYNTTGYHNTAVGTSALRSNTTGVLNTAVGWCALQNNTTGVYNTAMGRYSLQGNTTGAGNSAFGMHTLLYTSTGGYNTAMGESTLATNTTGNNNTGLGYYGLVNNTTGYDNTAVGSAALQNNTTGYSNVAVGRVALLNNTTGIQNTAVGALSLYSNSTGYSNSAMGYVALYNNTSGYANNAFGYGAMYVNTTGFSNCAFGHEALRGNTTQRDNCAFGYRSLYSNTGDRNTAVGYYTLYSNTTGGYNVAIGEEALYSNTTGYNNVAVGSLALQFNTNGHHNVAVGEESVNGNTTGYELVGVGAYSLYSNTTGYRNTAVGYSALFNITTGIQNTALGWNTGRGITTGSKNTIIGANVTGLSATLANNIIIADGDGNRRINVDSSGYVLINTNTTPSATGGNTPRLTVVGSQRTVFLHGENALFLLPAANNGAANGDAGLYVWISEPAQTWTGAGIARNMYNTTAFPRVNTSLSGQMIRFDEGTLIQFTVETSGGARSVPLTVGNGGTEVLAGNATDNGAYNLQCNGTAVWGAGAYVNGSDFRLKTNIKSLDSGLDIIKAVRPVTFQYKPEYNKDENIQTGFIAQELLEALKDKEYVDGIVQKGYEYLSVAYQNFIPILVKAIQELTTRVEELENK